MESPFASLKTSRHNFLDYYQVDKVLTLEQCENIIAMDEQCYAQNRSVLESHDGNLKVRDSNLYWISSADPSCTWIFDCLSKAILEANEKYFQFDLDGSHTALQLTHYGVGQFYSWHTDLGPGGCSRRKLSLSINLSQENDYSGGDLEFFRAEENIGRASRQIGNMTIFPSWMTHRVSTVERGERWSLVAWLEGPPFR